MATKEEVWANEQYAWWTALVKAGFTDDQAIAVLTAATNRVVIQPEGSPEMGELMSRITALLNRELSSPP